MKWRIRELLSLGGLVLACLTASQVRQLLDGQAAASWGNYLITTATGSFAFGLLVIGWGLRRTTIPPRTDDRELLAAIDCLFAHFTDDPPAQDAVRIVARAVIERRYRAKG